MKDKLNYHNYLIFNRIKNCHQRFLCEVSYLLLKNNLENLDEIKKISSKVKEIDKMIRNLLLNKKF